VILDDQRKPRAERFVAIIDAALEAWAARWPLYVGLAILSIAVEWVVAAAAQYDFFVVLVAYCIVDGFTTAFVTIDVAERVRETPRTARAVLRQTLIRWPIVIFVLALAELIEAAFSPWIFGSLEDMYYGMGILPALVVFGILGVATVIASIDEEHPLYVLPGYALVRSLLFAGAWPNLGRLVLAGAMLAVPMMAQQLLENWFTAHGVPTKQNSFWSNIPIDALTLAPFQAFFTYLYIDFTVRASEQR
jgi:hypothetical protein